MFDNKSHEVNVGDILGFERGHPHESSQHQWGNIGDHKKSRDWLNFQTEGSTRLCANGIINTDLKYCQT